MRLHILERIADVFREKPGAMPYFGVTRNATWSTGYAKAWAALARLIEMGLEETNDIRQADVYAQVGFEPA